MDVPTLEVPQEQVQEQLDRYRLALSRRLDARVREQYEEAVTALEAMESGLALMSGRHREEEGQV